ncbi:hypothetical protein TELCIR_19773, partial [Teladorsagia circumcincta]
MLAIILSFAYVAYAAQPTSLDEKGKKKPDQMDFQRHGFDADAMARFVADQTDVQ